MPTLKNWISASRLRTLPLSISGAVVGSSYAYYLGYFDFFISDKNKRSGRRNKISVWIDEI